MELNKCVEILNASVLVPAEEMNMEIKVACGADLMSDVMAFACSSNEMMLTGLVNPQTIRTAEMMDVKVIVFVRGKVPGENMLDLAKEKNICIMSTPLPMFTACGILYSAGIHGKGA
jgi:predicted transcriptional regulator